MMVRSLIQKPAIIVMRYLRELFKNLFGDAFGNIYLLTFLNSFLHILWHRINETLTSKILKIGELP